MCQIYNNFVNPPWFIAKPLETLRLHAVHLLDDTLQSVRHSDCFVFTVDTVASDWTGGAGGENLPHLVRSRFSNLGTKATQSRAFFPPFHSTSFNRTQPLRYVGFGHHRASVAIVAVEPRRVLCLSFRQMCLHPCQEFGTCLAWRAGLPTFHSLTASQPIAGYHTHLMPFWEVKKLSRSRSRQPSDPGDPEGQQVLDSNRAPFQPLAPKTSCRFMSFHNVSSGCVNIVNYSYLMLPQCFQSSHLSPSRDALDGNVHLWHEIYPDKRREVRKLMEFVTRHCPRV